MCKRESVTREMGDWIFIVLFGAAVIHIFEEYVYPGGFQDVLGKAIPRMALPYLTPKFHLAMNGLFLLLCFASLFIGKSNLVLSMSVISLVFVNAVLHIRGTIVTKRYYPGVISGALIYIPLAIYAYFVLLSSAQLTWIQAGLSFLMGVVLMGIPIIYVLMRRAGKAIQQRLKE
jgi:hypothetical protein